MSSKSTVYLKASKPQSLKASKPQGLQAHEEETARQKWCAVKLGWIIFAETGLGESNDLGVKGYGESDRNEQSNVVANGLS